MAREFLANNDGEFSNGDIADLRTPTARGRGFDFDWLFRHSYQSILVNRHGF
jgi:hypothetical protein